MAYVYILQSSKTGRYYIGSCRDLDERVNRHNSGHVPATRNFRPYKVAFSKEFSEYDEARNIEFQLKKFKRKDYIQKIIKSGKVTLRAISSSGRASDS